MDYFKKIEESIKFAWDNKQLWLFGIVISLFGGSIGNNSFTSFRDNNNNDFSTRFPDASDKLKNLVDNPASIITLVVLIIAVIIIALIGWYLSSVAKAALIQSVKLNKDGKKMTFKEGWTFGQTKVFTIIKLDLIGLLIVLLSILILSPIIVLTAIVPPILICLLCILIPVLIVVGILFAIAEAGALRYIVLKDMGAWESFIAGINLAKKAIVEYVLGFLVSILPGCAWAVIMIPLTFMAAMFMIVIFVALLLINPILALFGLIFIALIIFILRAALDSPYIVFSQTYWTKIIMELMEKYKD